MRSLEPVHLVPQGFDTAAQLRIVATGVALFIAMVIAAFLGWRQRSGVVMLVLLSLVWFTVDHDFEGPVLLALGGEHGIVLSDLVGILGVAVAVWLWFRHR